MKLLFCNIAWMDYYKGIISGKDEPQYGGSYVMSTGDAHEKYNFEEVSLVFDNKSMPDGDYCLGFVETKSSKGGRNQLHIEKIGGSAKFEDEDSINDVLVIYCAKHPYHKFTSVVGWYKHATVFRNYVIQELAGEDEGEIYEKVYNSIALKEDCVLLPKNSRKKTEWNVPRRQSGAAYGFGQANVWFAEASKDNKLLQVYLNTLVEKINTYDGENWIDKYPE